MTQYVKSLPTPHLVDFEVEYALHNPNSPIPMATLPELEKLGLTTYITGTKPKFDSNTQYLELSSIPVYDTSILSYTVQYTVVNATGSRLEELTIEANHRASALMREQLEKGVVGIVSHVLNVGIDASLGLSFETGYGTTIFVMAPVPASPSAGSAWTITIPSHSHIISVQGVLEKQVGGDIVPIGGNSADGQGVGWTINGTTLTLDDEVIDTKASGYIAVTYIP